MRTSEIEYINSATVISEQIAEHKELLQLLRVQLSHAKTQYKNNKRLSKVGMKSNINSKATAVSAVEFKLEALYARQRYIEVSAKYKSFVLRHTYFVEEEKEYLRKLYIADNIEDKEYHAGLISNSIHRQSIISTAIKQLTK